MNAVDELPPPGRSLPAAAAALPVGSQVEITYRDGSKVPGVITSGQGATWVECSDGATILLHTPWGEVDLSVIAAIRVLKDAQQMAAERAARKFGAETYAPPTTRDGYETTLYALAADIADLATQTRRMDFTAVTCLRKMQLEAQFDRLADQIALAKTRRSGATSCGRPLAAAVESRCRARLKWPGDRWRKHFSRSRKCRTSTRTP